MNEAKIYQASMAIQNTFTSHHQFEQRSGRANNQFFREKRLSKTPSQTVLSYQTSEPGGINQSLGVVLARIIALNLWYNFVKTSKYFSSNGPKTTSRSLSSIPPLHSSHLLLFCFAFLLFSPVFSYRSDHTNT